MGDESNAGNKVELGDFPYPLTKGPEESRYLTWLRNHSNYMATRGFLDYLRIGGVLVRGVVLNFLVLLSLLLVVSLVVGHLYGAHLRSLTISSIDDEQVKKFASQLQQKRPVDEWLKSNLSPGTLADLESLADPDDLKAKEIYSQLKPDLEAALRDLINGPSIYDTRRFGKIVLSDATKALLSTNPRGKSLRRLNRLLLDDAYPVIRSGEQSEHSRLVKWLLLPQMPAPFILTGFVVVGVLLWIVFSPILDVCGRIAGQRKSMERAGSDSSVKSRDKFERTFGFALLLIAAVALFEALPFLVEKFHHFRWISANTNWNTIFASAASISVAVIAGASRLLSVLGGAKKKVAMLLIGLMGLITPLLVILYVTEFLVYQEAYRGWLNSILGLLPFVFVCGILGIMLLGFVKRSFGVLEHLRLLGLAAGVCLATLVAVLALDLLVFPYDVPMSLWNYYFVAILVIELWLFCRLVVDVNRTSIHGLYRDRLASAYLVGRDTEGDVDIEEDINLGEIGCHEAGSTAPYHLVNVALNLQGSKDMVIRDRQSDFFIFSKRFIGGKRTGYCRTETMEQVHPTMSLATAMAISAAAASPNMGRGTNRALVAFMVLLNIRLGYWLPNPGRLEEKLFGRRLQQIRGNRGATKKTAPGFSFKEVFEDELIDIEKRWDNVYSNPAQRKQRRLEVANGTLTTIPTTEHGLVGLGFSGGGIRSATINLGIAQVLHERGIFDHVDYMSTVSGGGYLGSSISTLMRSRTKSMARRHRSEIEGVVSLETNAMGEKIVKVTGGSASGEQREYRFSKFDPLVVKTGDAVKAGQELIERHNTIWDQISWRVKPYNLVREMMMKLDETHKWVNLSDGGHIENLAGIELLRRRCKYIIIGDGEADPDLSFNGLATLIRYARIDLGINIDIDPGAIRVDRSKDAVDRGTDNLSREHWAFGTITYPPDNGRQQERGYLLYLKSSFSGDEDEVMKEYRHRNPGFPHESTADQFFSENQFESYRALGQHIGEKACEELSMAHSSDLSSFENFAEDMKVRAMVATLAAKAVLAEEKEKKELKWAEDLESQMKDLMGEAPTNSAS